MGLAFHLNHDGTPGGPPFIIPRPQLEALIELGFGFSRIAAIIGVSERTLRRRREAVGDNYSNISDAGLDAIIAGILQVNTLDVLCSIIWSIRMK